jgi:hypothetical protein
MLPLAAAVLVAVAVVLASLWLFLGPKLRPPLPSLRGPPTTSILLGNIDIFAAGKLHENFLDLAKGYGKFVRIRILWKWVRERTSAAGQSPLRRPLAVCLLCPGGGCLRCSRCEHAAASGAERCGQADLGLLVLQPRTHPPPTDPPLACFSHVRNPPPTDLLGRAGCSTTAVPSRARKVLLVVAGKAQCGPSPGHIRSTPRCTQTTQRATHLNDPPPARR